MADTYHTIECPACGKTMKKIFIPDAGINIDICADGCGGIFFDNREFEKFDEQNENVEQILKELEGKKFKARTDKNDDRFCPACGAKMVKNFSSVKHEIEIDECYSCGGKFLDNSELGKIRAEYKTAAERGEDIINHIFTAAQSADVDGNDLEYLRSLSEHKPIKEQVYNSVK